MTVRAFHFRTRALTTPSILLLLAVTLCGCGVKPVPGGTRGSLHNIAGPLSDIQITLHALVGSEYHPVGFGVADSDGRFQLYSNGAKGPLWLPPGEYSCTLESSGAPIPIPVEYQSPETSRLKFSWESGDELLDLEVPEI